MHEFPTGLVPIGQGPQIGIAFGETEHETM